MNERTTNTETVGTVERERERERERATLYTTRNLFETISLYLNEIGLLNMQKIIIYTKKDRLREKYYIKYIIFFQSSLSFLYVNGGMRVKDIYA